MSDKVLRYGSPLNNPLYTTGFKNKITNGGFRVAQRGTIFSALTTSGVKTADRWKYEAYQFSGSYSSKIEPSSMYWNGTYINSLKTTIFSPSTILSNTYFGVSQYFTGDTAYSLKGRSISLSFLFKAGIAGKYNVSFTNRTNDSSYVFSFNVPTINTVTYVQKHIYFDPSQWSANPGPQIDGAINIGYASGGINKTGVEEAWVGGSGIPYYTTAGTVDWISTNGAYIEVSNVQLEEGGYYTAFEERPYELELMLCQSDYQYVQVRNHIVGINPGTANAYGSIQLPIVMRASPTVEFDFSDPVTSVGGTTQTISSVSSAGYTTSINSAPFTITMNSTMATYHTGRVNLGVKAYTGY